MDDDDDNGSEAGVNAGGFPPGSLFEGSDPAAEFETLKVKQRQWWCQAQQQAEEEEEEEEAEVGEGIQCY